MRILLAEDNLMNIEIAQNILSLSGAIVTEAHDGEEAVEEFENSEPGAFHAILMDIQMPKLNGYEAAQRIRASTHPDASSIPIIAMTANAFDEDVQHALDAGMNAHIAKPLDIPVLLHTLSGYFRYEVSSLTIGTALLARHAAHGIRFAFASDSARHTGFDRLGFWLGTAHGIRSAWRGDDGAYTGRH